MLNGLRPVGKRLHNLVDLIVLVYYQIVWLLFSQGRQNTSEWGSKDLKCVFILLLCSEQLTAFPGFLKKRYDSKCCAFIKTTCSSTVAATSLNWPLFSFHLPFVPALPKKCQHHTSMNGYLLLCLPLCPIWNLRSWTQYKGTVAVPTIWGAHLPPCPWAKQTTCMYGRPEVRRPAAWNTLHFSHSHLHLPSCRKLVFGFPLWLRCQTYKETHTGKLKLSRLWRVKCSAF